ncbi:MAG: beta-propeller fold lactonase family protein [Crocinitomicaceae bacterium]|jgi:YVTN family beta-propeller protein|nr:beta-propeller fold lactonase family protein [Crocinitomicaceae bacterium]
MKRILISLFCCIGLSVFAAEKPIAKLETDAAPKIAIILNSGSASVTRIDMQKREVIDDFPIGKEPHHLMMMPDGKNLIVANAAADNLVLLDAATGNKLGTVPKIIDPYQIGFSPNNKWFVVAGNRLDRVDIYPVNNGNIVPKPDIYKLPETPSHIAFTSDSQITFVTLQDSNEVVAIDLQAKKELWKMKVGKMPAGLWMTPGDKYLLLGVTGQDFVQVIDWKTQKIIKTIKTGRGAHNFRPLGDGRHVFVTNRVSATISKIDMETLENIATIKGLPAGPDCMDITPNQKELWVTFRFSKKVGVINLTTNELEKTIKVGNSPHGVFFTPNAAWQ